AGPSGRIVFPQLLKGFLEKVGTDGLEVVAEQIAQAEVLVVAEILAAAEQQPTGLLEDRGARPSRFMRLVHGRCPVPCSYWRRCGSGRGYAAPRSSFRG